MGGWGTYKKKKKNLGGFIWFFYKILPALSLLAKRKSVQFLADKKKIWKQCFWHVSRLPLSWCHRHWELSFIVPTSHNTSQACERGKSKSWIRATHVENVETIKEYVLSKPSECLQFPTTPAPRKKTLKIESQDSNPIFLEIPVI